MRPARWDIEWRVGGSWWVRLQRKAATGEVLPLADPCVFEVRADDSPDAVAPRLALTGTRVETEDGDAVEFLATAEQVRALGPGIFEHVAKVGDPDIGQPVVLFDGKLRVRDRVAGR